MKSRSLVGLDGAEAMTDSVGVTGLGETSVLDSPVYANSEICGRCVTIVAVSDRAGEVTDLSMSQPVVEGKRRFMSTCAI